MQWCCFSGGLLSGTDDQARGTETLSWVGKTCSLWAWSTLTLDGEAAAFSWGGRLAKGFLRKILLPLCPSSFSWKKNQQSPQNKQKNHLKNQPRPAEGCPQNFREQAIFISLASSWRARRTTSAEWTGRKRGWSMALSQKTLLACAVISMAVL